MQEEAGMLMYRFVLCGDPWAQKPELTRKIEDLWREAYRIVETRHLDYGNDPAWEEGSEPTNKPDAISAAIVRSLAKLPDRSLADQTELEKRMSAIRGYIVSDARRLVVEMFERSREPAICQADARRLLSGDKFLWVEFEERRALFTAPEIPLFMEKALFSRKEDIERAQQFLPPTITTAQKWTTILLCCCALHAALSEYSRSGIQELVPMSWEVYQGNSVKTLLRG